MGLLFGGPAPPAEAEAASQRQVDMGTSSKFVLKFRKGNWDGISRIEMKAIFRKCNSPVERESSEQIQVLSAPRSVTSSSVQFALI